MWELVTGRGKTLLNRLHEDLGVFCPPLLGGQWAQSSKFQNPDLAGCVMSTLGKMD